MTTSFLDLHFHLIVVVRLLCQLSCCPVFPEYCLICFFSFPAELFHFENLVYELHKPSLIKTRLLCRDLFFSDQLLPPFFAFLLEVPLLHVVDQTNMVELFCVFWVGYSLKLSPEKRIRWGLLPSDPDDEQWIVKKIQAFEKVGVFS